MNLSDIRVKITKMGDEKDDFAKDYYSETMRFIGLSGPIIYINKGLWSKWQVRIAVEIDGRKWEPIVYIGAHDLPRSYLGGVIENSDDLDAYFSEREVK